MKLRLMTFNIAGGKRAGFRADPVDRYLDAIVGVIRDSSPDILVLQEATDWQRSDGSWSSVATDVAAACGFGDNFHFAPTLTMSQHMHVGKDIMVTALFEQVLDWRQGNAVYARAGFVGLGNPLEAGGARSAPIFRAPQYEGDRNTEPRHALLARPNYGPVFPLVIGTHLTTLTDERGPAADPARFRHARELRAVQAERILKLARAGAGGPGQVVILMGDFNALPDEPCLATVLGAEGGFELLRGVPVTHREIGEAIDHILVYPRDRLLDYRCWSTESCGSDHLPVIADVVLRAEEPAPSG